MKVWYVFESHKGQEAICDSYEKAIKKLKALLLNGQEATEDEWAGWDWWQEGNKYCFGGVENNPNKISEGYIQEMEVL